MSQPVRSGEPASAREARLVIAEHMSRRDNLGGAWWPRTRSAAQEIPLLLTGMHRRFRAVLGLTLTLDEWPGADIAHQYCGPRTKVSWYGLPTRDLAVLHVEGARRVNLLVVPPSTLEPVAVRAMLMACTPGNSRTPDQLLADASAAALLDAEH